MADTRTDNGSPERVALELMSFVSASTPIPEGRKAWLDLYAECLAAAKGKRVI